MPMRPSPSRRSMFAPVSAATRLSIRPTVRQATRSSSATAAWEVWTASHAAVSSNAQVKPAPWRAQGTAATTTPCRRQVTRGASASRNACTTPKIQRAPASASLAVARDASTADAAPATLTTSRPHQGDDRLGFLVERYMLDHGVLDVEQPRPYPLDRTPFHPLGTQPSDSREPSGGTACSHGRQLRSPTDQSQEPYCNRTCM